MRVWTRGVESGFVAMPRAVTVSGRDQLAFNTLAPLRMSHSKSETRQSTPRNS
jgi:hypothetical protein